MIILGTALCLHTLALYSTFYFPHISVSCSCCSALISLLLSARPPPSRYDSPSIICSLWAAGSHRSQLTRVQALGSEETGLTWSVWWLFVVETRVSLGPTAAAGCFSPPAPSLMDGYSVWWPESPFVTPSWPVCLQRSYKKQNKGCVLLSLHKLTVRSLDIFLLLVPDIILLVIYHCCFIVIVFISWFPSWISGRSGCFSSPSCDQFRFKIMKHSAQSLCVCFLWSLIYFIKV